MSAKWIPVTLQGHNRQIYTNINAAISLAPFNNGTRIGFEGATNSVDVIEQVDAIVKMSNDANRP